MVATTHNPATSASSAEVPRPWMAGHWRGELPLPRSFWLLAVLPPVLLALALGGLASWMAVRGEGLRAGAALLLVGWPLAGAAMLWGAAGAWRSSTRWLRDGRAPLWGWLARAGLVALVAAGLATTALNVLPQVPACASLALGRDPLGQVQARVTPDGRHLLLRGHLGLGDGARVQRLLQDAPRVRLVELASPGGRAAEALAIAAAVRQRRAQTRVVGRCDNACVRVFLAGSGRQVMPEGRLGLHRQDVPSLNPLWRSLARSDQAQAWREAGLPEAFILNTLSSPPASPWMPGHDDLVAAALVGNPERPLEVPLPAADGAQPADFAQALASNRVWRALDQRFPGTLDRAAERMHAAYAARSGDAAQQVEGLRVLQARVPELLLDAGPEIRDQFLALTADQLAAARSAGPAACDAVLAGDAAAVQALPAALAQREAAWLMDAVAEPPPATPARRASTLEVEVMRRTLGDRAPALLAGLGRAARAEGRGPACELATALITEVLRLPAAERKLATRLIFQP